MGKSLRVNACHVFGTEQFKDPLPIHCQAPGHVGPAPQQAHGPELTLSADQSFNQVIAALMQGERPTWLDHLEHVELSAQQQLCSTGQPTQHIHFPTTALVVLMHGSDPENDTSVALVGRDGLVGMAAFMGAGVESHRAVVLHPGGAWRLPTRAVPADGPTAGLVVKAAVGHLLSLTSQMSQTAFCQQHHSAEQRLARWLLNALDRLPGDAVDIPLDQLARLLALAPDELASAAAQLVAAGALVCEPGRLVVLHRAALVEQSCGCHVRVQATVPATSPPLA